MAEALSRRLEGFTYLSPSDRVFMESLCNQRARQVSRGQNLFLEDDQPEFAWIVLSGWAARYKMLPDGRRLIVGLLLPGDLCDPDIFILHRMDHSAVALTALSVAQLGRADFERLTANDRLLQAFNWQALAGMGIQREWTFRIGRRNAFEQVAHLMCEIYHRLDCVGLAKKRRIPFPLTQGDIADMLGLTSIHVSRIIQELRKTGWIELSRRTLAVNDLEALQEAAIFNPNYLHMEQGCITLDEVA